MEKILITGCGRGLGKSLFKELISRQYSVIPHFKTIPIKTYPINVIGNINDNETIDIIEKTIIENGISVIINNAAIYTHKNFIDLSDDEITELIKTDLISQILITKRAYKYFKEKNNGIIININSLAGKYPSLNESIYCAAKFGLDGFSKSLQIESKGLNIKFIDFYIGAMKTDMSTWKSNYEDLLDPNEVASFICDVFSYSYKTIGSTEYVIRRKQK